MWEDTLIESKRKNRGKWRWITVTAAAGLHAVVIAVITAMSIWNVAAVSPPQQPMVILDPIHPDDPLPVTIVKHGIPEGDDKPMKVDSVVVPPPPVTQQDLVPSMDPVEDSNLQGDASLDPSDSNEPGKGPIGLPNGDSDVGSLIGSAGPMDEVPPIIVRPEMQRPVLIKKIEPGYPDMMRRAGIQGYVVLQAVISKTGEVENVEVLRSLNPVLDRESIQAVQQWKYKPAMLNGRPVRVYFTVTVSYKIVR